MLRKLLFGVFVLLFLAAVGYFYFYFNKDAKPPVSEAVKAIPINASFIFESRSPVSLYKKIASSNLMWADLNATSYFDSLNAQCRYIDSLLATEQDFLSLENEQSFFWSGHHYGADRLGYLFVFALPDMKYKGKIESFFKTKFRAATINNGEYDKVTITSVTLSPQSTFHYAIYRSVFVGSFVKDLIEESIGQFANNISLLNDPDFVKVMQAAGDKKDAWLYVNYKTLPHVVEQFVGKSHLSFASAVTSFAGWSEWDCTFNTNEIMLNGFTNCKDSLGNYLSLFARQTPQRPNITSIIPSSVSYFQFMGISNMRFFLNDYRMYLEARHKYFEYEQYWETLNGKLRMKADEKFTQLIGNEMALVVTGSMADRVDDDVFAVFQLKDAETSADKMVRLTDTLARILDKEIDTVNYHKRTIHRLNIPNFIPRIFGTPFDKIENNYYVILGNYAVFANSVFALQNFMSAYDNGRVLSKDAAYLDFSKEHITRESNLYIYCNVARAAALYSYYATEHLQRSVEENNELFRKFQAVALTFSSSKGMFYSSIYLRHNPETKKQISSLWETSLDAPCSSTPKYLVNHTNQTNDIFVQDDQNNIYLISNTGKILWKREFDEHILSDIHQVDLYKNDKLQMLFNTGKMLYAVDRNGKDVKGFPIKLPTHANGPLSLFDYEQKRDYRIFIPASGKNMYVYNGKAERIKDVEIHLADEVNQAPLHVSMNGKDNIIMVDRGGKIYVTDRQGNIRVNIADQLPNDKITVEMGKDISTTRLIAIDSIGVIHILWLNGKKERIETEEFDSPIMSLVADIDNDKINEVVIVANGTISVYSFDGKRKFTIAIREEVSDTPQFIKVGPKSGYLVLVSRSTNQIFAFDGLGKLHPNFPVFGATPVEIIQTGSDKDLHMVTVSGNKVYLYQLD